MRNILSATKVESLYTNPVPGQYKDGNRLYLIVSPKGVLSFRYRMELDGKRNWITIGRYPAITLALAREKAINYSQIVAQGEHPKLHFKEVKKKEQELKRSIADLCAEYIEHEAPRVRKKEDSLKALIRIINNEIVAKIGAYKVSELTSQLVHRKLIQPKIKDSPASCKRNIITLNQIIRYGISLEYLPNNPLADKILPSNIYKDQVGERYLSFEELEKLLNCVYKANIRTQWAIVLNLLILLMCRKNELLKSKFKDLILDENPRLSIPENKTNRPTEIPLSKHAVKLFEVLKELNGDSEYIFSSVHAGKHPSHNALNQVLKFAETLLDSPWTPHSLRRTGATQLEKLGVNFIVIECLLNHQWKDGSKKHYLQYGYWKERREALEMWSEKVQGLIKPELLPYSIDKE